jgi:MbtH protein
MPKTSSPRLHTVVRNEDEEYSIWPADAPPPAGWSRVGVDGSEAECLSHIAKVWTDMRPASVRAALARRDCCDDDATGVGRRV